jgi:hypothetical protein
VIESEDMLLSSSAEKKTRKNVSEKKISISQSETSAKDHRTSPKQSSWPVLGRRGHRKRTSRYDGFNLKKEIRDSRTEETPRPYSSTCLFLASVKSNPSRDRFPSLRHRGILSRQSYTPMKSAPLVAHCLFREFLHGGKFHIALDRGRLSWRTSSEVLVQKFYRSSVQGPHVRLILWASFSFSTDLLLYPKSILSSDEKHNGSIHKYTQLVMLTHYSPLRGWLSSVTLGHNHNQTEGWKQSFRWGVDLSTIYLSTRGVYLTGRNT